MLLRVGLSQRGRENGPPLFPAILFQPHQDGSSRVSFREASSADDAESKEVILSIAPAGSTGLRPLPETNLWRKRVVMAL
jgi:hypothetical protein